MAIVRWRPAASLSNRWPEMFDDDFFSGFTGAQAGGLEVYETKNQVVVQANVAGVPDDNIDITFERGLLTINAQLQEEEQDNQERTYYSRSTRAYSYRLNVPGDLDLSKEPEAEVENGVLKITFSKSEEALPKKLQIKNRQK